MSDPQEMPSPRYLHTQSKALLRDVQARRPEAVERVFFNHPQWAQLRTANLRKVFTLADAECVIAREREYPDWSELMRAANAGTVPRLRRPGNPYLDVVDSMQTKSLRLRAGTILSALPGRRPLENRGRPVSRQKLDALIWGLGHPNPVVRWQCLELLDAHPDARAIPYIAACLDDEVPRVRWHAVHALACDACKDGQTFVTESVAARLAQVAERDSNAKVRRYAGRELAQMQAC